MKKYGILLAVILIGFAISALRCGMGGTSARPSIERTEWPVMGTIAALSTRGVDAARQAAMRAEVVSLFARHEELLSSWNPSSELSILAREGKDGCVCASLEVRPCYKAARQLQAETEGAFNPEIGKILRNLEPCRRRRTADIDLGAIAKGFSVDVAAAGLGAADVLVDLGGNLKACGGSWLTGIRNPFESGALAAQFTLTNGEAVATSGNYERFVVTDGKRVSHILDGRTGKPVSGMAAVTVVAPSAMWADGLSTALFILGPDEGARLLAAKHPDALALWIPDTPESPKIFATPAMAVRLKETRFPVILTSEKEGTRK